MENVKLGQRVRDTISGIEGIVIARTEWLYGCSRVTVQPEGAKDGKPYDYFVVDEPQLEPVDGRDMMKEATPQSGRHGARDDVGRRADVSR